MYIKTTATRKLLNLTKRIRGISGGASASKTDSIILILIAKAQSDTIPTITSIVSETLPHLKKGAIRDFKQIMTEHNYWDDNRWNATDLIYTFKNKSIIEFFSADQPGKVRGPRRDRLFINEANNVSYETFDQLEIRTNDEIWMDWNPVTEFWFYTEVLPLRNDVDFLILTYRDNEALTPSIVASMEQRKANKNWWLVYGEGQLGDAEGRIYTGWTLIDDVPQEARLEKYGLDFGYSNDPTASDAIYKWNDAIVIDQVIHQLKLSNRNIADIFLNMQRALVVADSAEPKSIDEISSCGIAIVGANKGKDSINQGIQLLQNKKVFITKRSVDTIKEYRNYLWLKDANGKTLNEPSPIWNHHMDDIRYAVSSGQTVKPWVPNNPGGVLPYYDGLPG